MVRFILEKLHLNGDVAKHIVGAYITFAEMSGNCCVRPLSLIINHRLFGNRRWLPMAVEFHRITKREKIRKWGND
jgi:hypothetical protein